MRANIVKSINEIQRVGKEQADQFMKEKKTGNKITSQNASKNKKKNWKRTKLFAQLFITVQVRGGDLHIQDWFFIYKMCLDHRSGKIRSMLVSCACHAPKVASRKTE